MINDRDFERLMIQQYLLYKKLTEIQDRQKGRICSHSDAILIKQFNKECDEIKKNMRQFDIKL